ncbi:MAG: hypothetical protein KKB30_02330 [Proteobacteria bacterium]|nr:hypothetical protein [Pseudomonadota bacterium]MBU1715828.1 hypothetical protein [Pseudomonadota bacterium]
MGKNPTLDEVMSSEIKREIAQRYFGFRKLIEEDELALSEKIKHYSYILQKRISFDLIRIYVLLRDEEIVLAFLELAGLHEKLFYDPYLAQSPNISRRVLACQRFHGFFRANRFKNFIFDCYENLIFHTELYHRKVSELEDEQVIITEEIKQFYHDNDLSVILRFIQSMSDPLEKGPLPRGSETGLAEGLDKKLNIAPPLPIEQVLTILPVLKPLAEIKSSLKRLIKKAYAVQPPEILAIFDQKDSGCERNERNED